MLNNNSWSIIKFALWLVISMPAIADNYYMAIKGGISLGNYETGLNREVLKQMRSNKDIGWELTAFSGASAGSINSILSAIDSCIKDKTINFNGKSINDKTDSNFMQESWDIGIVQLARPPEEGEHVKSLFSRKDFLEKKALLKSLLNNQAITGCQMIFTMSVTRLLPYKHQIEELKETIDFQRFVVPLMAKEVDGRLKFVNYSMKFENGEKDDNSKAMPSIYLRLIEDEHGYIDFDHVWNLAMASSSFPMAFEPVELIYCHIEKLAKARVSKCTLPGLAEKSKFSDGGLFDNSPIGVALDVLLTKNESQSKGQYTPNSRIIFINPDFFRNEKMQIQHPSPELNGIGGWGSYLGEAFATAQSYEYRNALKTISNKLGYSSLYFSNRYHDLLADIHFHFGAFYAKEYRIHDYLVGTYDGAHIVARIKCDRNDVSYNTCVRENVYAWILQLERNRGDIDSDSLNFIKHLYNTEYDKSLHIDEPHQNGNIYIALAKAFESKSGGQKLSYKEYLSNLRELTRGFAKSTTISDDLKNIIYNGSHYTRVIASQLYDNSLDMQIGLQKCDNCNNDAINDGIGKALMYAQPVAHSLFAHHETGLWPLPWHDVFGLTYGFNFNQKNHTLGFNYRPSWAVLPSVSADFGLGLSYFGSELKSDHYKSLSAGLTYHRDNFFNPTVGAGYQYETKGEHIYDSNVHSIYLKAGFLGELIYFKYLYRTSPLEYHLTKTRDDSVIEISLDVSKLFAIAF